MRNNGEDGYVTPDNSPRRRPANLPPRVRRVRPAANRDNNVAGLQAAFRQRMLEAEQARLAELEQRIQNGINAELAGYPPANPPVKTTPQKRPRMM